MLNFNQFNKKKEKKEFLAKVRKVIPDIPNFSSLFASRQEITRVLYYNQIYQNLYTEIKNL